MLLCPQMHRHIFCTVLAVPLPRDGDENPGSSLDFNPSLHHGHWTVTLACSSGVGTLQRSPDDPYAKQIILHGGWLISWEFKILVCEGGPSTVESTALWTF